MDTIVITGICGTHGKIISQILCEKYKIIGIDNKNWVGTKPANIEIVQGDLRRRVFANVLQKHDVKAVIHLAITKHFNVSLDKRHSLNVLRAQRVIEGCMKYKVPKVILLSEHSVYGALPDSPLWLKENAPLSGSRLFKENTSIISADHMFSELFWKVPEISTVILRPVNILGPKTRGLLNTYLKLDKAPAVFGFDPFMQIIHERDVAHAIELALEKDIKGKFNVTGSGSLPLSVLSEETGVKSRILPAPLAHGYAEYRFKTSKFPFPGCAISFFQFPISIDGSEFKKVTGFEPKISLKNTIQSIKGFVKLASEVWVGDDH